MRSTPEARHNPLGGRMTHVVMGMSLMSVAMLIAPGMDVIAKYLGTTGNVTPGSVTFGRFAVQAVFLFLLLVTLTFVGKKKRIWPKNIAGNLLRGALMGLASFLFFTAVTLMPVTDAISIFFVEPFILTILSALLLGEKVGWRRRVAVLVGFSGALLVIQPSFEEVGAAAFLPIFTALIFACYLILTRKIADDDDPLAMQFAAGIGGTLFMFFALLIGGGVFAIEPLVTAWPQTSFLWGLVLFLGLLGTGSHLLIVVALSRAPASILAPFQYIEIVSATILGFVIFAEFPNAIKWVGISIIVGSGVYVFWREARISQQEEVST